MTVYKQVRNVWTPEEDEDFGSRGVGLQNVLGISLQVAALVGLIWLAMVVIGMAG